MNYNQTIEYLFSSLPMYQRTGAAAYKNSLDTTLAMDEAHNHPHLNFKSLHIAGTNGKGSVSHMLASILTAAGYRTGLYTSPHLLDFRERIKINGKMIPEINVIEYTKKNKELFNKLQASFFEMTADLAFSYFAEKQVDFAVIETGMGGRLDSTNILRPILSIITNIGLDHTRFLGDSIEKIAAEKAGIIKDEVPVIIGEFHKDSFPVFETFSKEKNARLVLADKRINHEFSLLTPERLFKHKFSSEKRIYNNLISDLIGNYQIKNIKTVLASIECLEDMEYNIPIQAIYTGLKEVKKSTGLRGRWEEISYNPLVICDSAHNGEGVIEIVEQIKNTPYRKLHIVWGMVSDKDSSTILKLLPKDANYYFTRAQIPRALDENILQYEANKFGLKGKAFPNVSEAFKTAKRNAGKEDFIFIGGSTFVVADLLAFLMTLK